MKAETLFTSVEFHLGAKPTPSSRTLCRFPDPTGRTMVHGQLATVPTLAPFRLASPTLSFNLDHKRVANSRYLQNAFASCIWRGVRHSGSNKRGDATTAQMHFAREVATFRRLAL